MCLHTGRLLPLLASLLATPAMAWDVVSELALDVAASKPRTRHVAASASGAHWQVAQHANDIVSVDRYASAGELLSRQFEPHISELSGGALASLRLQILSDGSAFGTDDDCVLWRFSAQGTLNWRSRELPQSAPCRNLAATAGGAVWVTYADDGGPNLGLRRLDALGRDLGRVDQQISQFEAFSNVLAVPSSESAWIGGASSVNAGTQPTVVQVDAAGNIAWRWHSTAAGSARMTQLTSRPGGLYAAGRGVDGQLLVVALSPSGIPEWTLTYAGLRGADIRELSVANDGRLIVIGREPTNFARSLVIISPMGSVMGQRDLPAGLACIEDAPGCAPIFGADGRVYLLLESALALDQPLRLLTISGTGELLDNREIAQILGAEQLIARNGDWLVRRSGVVHALANDGSAQALSNAAAAPAMSPILLGEYAFGAERYAALANGPDLLVIRADANGQKLWQKRLPGTALNAELLSEQAIQLSGTQVCVMDERATFERTPLRCLDRESGELRFEWSFPTDQAQLWGMFANSVLAYSDIAADGTLLMRRRNVDTGSELQPVSLPNYDSAAFSDVPLRLRVDVIFGDAMTIVGKIRNSNEIVAAWFDQNDQDSFRHSLTQEPAQFFPVNNLLYLFETQLQPNALTTIHLRVVNATNANQLQLAEIGTVQSNAWQVRRAQSGGQLHLALSNAVPENRVRSQTVTRLMSVPLNGASILWQRNIDMDLGALVDLSAIHSRDAVMVVDQRIGALRARLYAAANGAVLDERAHPCGGTQCFARSHTPLGNFDTWRVLATNYAPTSGQSLRSYRVNLTTGGAHANQNAVAGTWYNPATSGQGFVLTYVPESRTIFAPWFTFASGEAHGDQSALRWYSLQGNATDPADVVNLQILRNSGGRFAAPPTTSSAVVGNAQLRFHDCDRATLFYRFDDATELGQVGAMPLVRLGPRLRACQIGSLTQTPTLQVGDAQGFSARQSGAWYDESASGQGLMLDVIPAGAGQTGLLFAAWFTYDPQMPANDAAAQDWFVLQSDLQTATGGEAQLPILRIVGGELDRVPTANLAPIGSARLRFSSCERLVFDYQFDTTELAAEHAGRSGSLQLQRIGGCGPVAP